MREYVYRATYQDLFKVSLKLDQDSIITSLLLSPDESAR